MTLFGIHTNVQGKPIDDLLEVWRHADRLGFGWISISDHLPGETSATSLEAVACHAALALVTERARCAVLTYVAGFRHPAVIASAAITIDHLSGGRAAIGLGSGSLPQEFARHGFPFPTAAARTDVLEECLRCVTTLLRGGPVAFAGEHIQLTDVAFEPRPVQRTLPVWVGVAGRRGIRMTAELGDGWNAPYLTVREFAAKLDLLHRECDSFGRRHDDVRASANLLLLLDTNRDAVPEKRQAAALAGSVDEVVDQIGAYVDVGADQLNFFLPYPWNLDALERLASALRLPAR